MDFIREIQEARMTRTESNTRRYSYADVCERAYLILLCLELLRRYPGYDRKVREYARNTSRYTGYDTFRASATDLYNFLYFVDGDETAISKLKDPEKSQKNRDNTSVPIMAINRYLSKLSNGQEPTASSEMFIKIEQELSVADTLYKHIRRTVTNLDRSSAKDVDDAVQKLTRYAQKTLRGSDIIDLLEKLSKDDTVAAYGTTRSTQYVSTQPKISNEDLVYLQRIVGQRNLYLALKYIELSAQGKPIPSNVAKAFDPAIDVLVDIIKGGPSSVGKLLQIQKDAKRRQKR